MRMSISELVAAPLSDGRVQLWMNTPEYIYTVWETNTSPGAPWSGWQTFPGPFSGVPVNFVQQIAAAPLPDERLQLWAVYGGAVFTEWNTTTDPNSGWSGWQAFTVPGLVQQIAAAPLSDRRLQLWAVSGEEILTEWKTTTAPDASWSGWEAFPTPGAVQRIAPVPLPDGRLELWAITTDNKLYSEWKTTTAPDAPWSGWEAFPTPSAVQQIAAARLPDGRLQLWAITTDNKLYSEWKTTTAPDAPWSGWQDFFPSEWSWLNLGHGESSGGLFKCNYTLNLTIRNDGTCRFWGSYTNLGDAPGVTAPDQTFGVSIAVGDSNGQAYAFNAGGKVHSAPQSGSTFSWDQTQKSPAIANNWEAILLRHYANYGYSNSVTISDVLSEIGTAAGQIANTVKAVAGAVETVIQVVAAA
jgi:hypothetical protein